MLGSTSLVLLLLTKIFIIASSLIFSNLFFLYSYFIEKDQYYKVNGCINIQNRFLFTLERENILFKKKKNNTTQL